MCWRALGENILLRPQDFSAVGLTASPEWSTSWIASSPVSSLLCLPYRDIWWISLRHSPEQRFSPCIPLLHWDTHHESALKGFAQAHRRSTELNFLGLSYICFSFHGKSSFFFQVVLGPDWVDHTLGSVRARCWNSNHSALLWLLWACHLQKTTNQWKTTFPWFSSSIKLLSSANIISRHSWTKIYLSSNKWHHIFSLTLVT